MDFDQVLASNIHQRQEDNDTNDLFMRLRADEHARALQVKAAAGKDSRIRNLSDFSCVQWALTTQGLPMEVICERIYLMQCFREEYRLIDELEDGLELIVKFAVDQQPGVFLSFDYIPAHNNYCTVQDMAKVDPKAIQTDYDMRVHLGANFYLWQAAFPNFESMRNGHTLIIECKDSSFANYDERVMQKYMHEFWNNYPKIDANYLHLNTPSFINFLYGMCKRFFPLERLRAYRLGQQIEGLEGTRLDAVYNTPTAEVARVKMIHKIGEALLLRYSNQANFSLTNCQLVR